MMKNVSASVLFPGFGLQGAVPASRRETRFSVGRVLAVQGDSQVPDCLYYVPARRDCARAPLVSVHGISRNALQHLMAFRSYAEEAGTPLAAPIFSKRDFRGYQTLGYKAGFNALAGFDLLLQRLDRVFARHGGKIDLIGFSGGAQFAHRYAMARPQNINALALAAAGWYSHPDIDAAFPYGVAGPRSPVADLDAFLALPMLVLAGSFDVERDSSLRRGRTIDRRQGVNRLQRARSFAAAVNASAGEAGLPPPATFVEIAGAGHSFVDCAEAGLVRSVGDFLQRHRPASRQSGEGAVA